MEKDEKELRNHNGQKPSDKPTKELITPRKKEEAVKNRKSSFNTTGKDYKLGSNQTTR